MNSEKHRVWVQGMAIRACSILKQITFERKDVHVAKACMSDIMGKGDELRNIFGVGKGHMRI
jgi:hypothetical protein